MRIAFFGTSTFAVPSLEALVTSRHQVALCVTQPDRPSGRGRRVAASPVETAARQCGLTLLQPQHPSASDSIDRIRAARPDLLVVIAYGCILRAPLLAVAPQGAISLHPSLLPRYRGAAPIAWALINGDRTTGLSVFRLVEAVDAGDLIAQEETPIDPHETAAALGARLAIRGAQLLVESIDLMARGRVSYRPQPTIGASYARKLTKADGCIDWRATAPAIHRLIRGAQPWPGAYTWWGNRCTHLWQSQPVEASVPAAPGTVVEAGATGVAVAAGGATALRIDELQLAGGRRVAADAFLRGHRLAAGERFSSDGPPASASRA